MIGSPKAGGSTSSVMGNCCFHSRLYAPLIRADSVDGR